MVIGEVANFSSTTIGSLVVEVGKIGVWIKAAGIFVILWIIFESVILWLNWKRIKEIYKIKKDMKRMEKKLDRIEKKM